MDDQAYRALHNQIDEMRRELNEFRAPSGLDLMTAGRGINDEFWGDQLDPRWSTAATAGSGIAPVVQATAPSRALFDTGAVNGGVSQLDEAANYKWSAANAFTVIAIARLNVTTTVTYYPIRIGRVLGTDDIGITFDTSLSTGGNFIIRSFVGGVQSDSVAIQAIDTNYHTIALSVRTGVARARIDGGLAVELSTGIPTVDMQAAVRIVTRANVSRQLELDYFRLIPGVNLF